MTILITGGGFVGRSVVKELLKQGHTVVDLMRDFARPFADPKHIFVYSELCDVNRIVETIRTYKVERIINIAGQSHPPMSIAAPMSTVHSNVVCTMGILEAARLTGVKRVVLYSSEASYGNIGMDLVKLESIQRPVTPYGVTKVFCEMMGRVYNSCYGMECVTIRLGEVYGPGRITSETVQEPLDAALAGKPFIREHGRDQHLQLIHIDDAVQVSIKACMAEKINELATYNATSGGHPTFGEAIDILKELIPGAVLEVGDGTMGYDVCGELDISETIRDLGYEPKVSLRQGLTEYVQYQKEHPVN